MANTYYSYGYDVGFWMDYFIHFYDEIPGLGRVFYAGFCLNQITFSGTYEIDMTNYTFKFHFEKAGDITSGSDGTTMTLDYAASAVDPFGDIAQTLLFVQE